MKLHLPKLLFTALIAAAGITQAEVTSIPFYTENNNVPSKEDNWYTFDTTDVELNTGDKLGAFDENGNALALGQLTYDSKNGQTSSGNVTQNVKIDGTLTINGDAQVRLGGQYKLTSTVIIFGTSTKNDEYTGIIADKVVVNGTGNGTHLSSWNATVNTLEVNSGKVELHTGLTSGNSYFVYDAPNGSKQVRISEALNINGGTTIINNNQKVDSGYNAEDDKHICASFGSLSFVGLENTGSLLSPKWVAEDATIHKAWINITEDQEGIETNLLIRGKTASVGGLNIRQSGGTASISADCMHILSDYGDSTIIQSGTSEDTSLTIGKIIVNNDNYNKIVGALGENGVVFDESDASFSKEGKSFEINPSISITQEGLGKINMNGIDFTHQKTGAASTEKSTINQSGGGTINLGGIYSGVTFNIEQKESGGAINVNGNLATDIVTQKAAGTIEVAEDKTLTANNIYAGTVEETFDAEGNVISRSGSVEISNAQLTNGSLSTSDNSITNTGILSADSIAVKTSSTVQNEGFIIVNGAIVLKDGATLVNKGNITSSSSFALMTADEQAAVILSETEDLIILEEGSSLVNEGNIEKEILVQGGTLTLNDSGYTQDITLESGTIYVTDSGVQTGALTLKGGTINFSDGASVALGEDDVLNLDGADIIVSVADTNTIETGSIVTLFGSTGTVSGVEGTEITFTDENNGKVTGTLTDAGNGSFTVTVVPEPATATLSLLALAGLAMRRRRK